MGFVQGCGKGWIEMRIENNYRLTMVNDSGACETTSHVSRAAVRRQIRIWQAERMTCSVYCDGVLVYSGSALSFK